MQKKHYIPIGIDDFKNLIEDNYYFVDKSLLIKELLDSRAKVTLIPRPRRFGKTLNLSMIRYFFEKVVDRSYPFETFCLQQNPQGERPSIQLSTAIPQGKLQGERENSILDTKVQEQENNKTILRDILTSSAHPEGSEGSSRMGMSGEGQTAPARPDPSILSAHPEGSEGSSRRVFMNGVKAAPSRRHLFNGLKIEQHPDCMQEQGKYPVIWLTFKDVKTLKWQDCYEKIRKVIGNEFDRHFAVLKPILNNLETQRVYDIIAGTASQASYENALLDLSAYLERAYQERVVILIDEYDAPIHAGYLNNYYDEVVDFMRGFLGAGLKGNTALNFGVMTGILRIAKESIFSGLNNLRVCTLIQDSYSNQFGLLEEEVKTMLDYFGLENHLDEVRQWYDGYQSGKYKIYNPWSIINLIDNGGAIRAYWVNTSDNALIKNLLRQCSPKMKEDFEILMNGGLVKKIIQENIVMPDIDKNDEALWNFLLFCGYLTFENYQREERSIFADFKIPNEEVFLSYENSFRNWFMEGTGVRDYQDMLESLVEGRAEEFQDFFIKLTNTTLSAFDVNQNEPERFYHALVLGMLSSLSSSHEVRSNRESGWGRQDVMIIPKNRSKTGAVIEFKSVDLDARENIESAAQNALKQIEEKQYESELKALGVTRILKIGIAFQGKESFVLIK